MKHLKTLLIAAILLVGTTSIATAQSKVAHINTTELVQAMPEMKAAQAEIEKLSKTYDADYKTMVTELQNKVKLYRAEVDTKTEEENTKRAKEVQDIEQGIRQYQAQAQEDLAKKEAALLKPIFEKAKAAIQKVAAAQGFNYVLDSTEGGGVLVAAGTDILADVKKELGF
ncbi:OmpH family outer membrane protein [Psychroserpens sp.]|uniref:OmpH family outer membrane protein n=1 Tax=Psychroserpens sp. TaxID=2020870 RepID=UPI001B073B6C|nr:OmpH family outer membrane protein [Psychroserpens sp.]MBO6607866.1 OmpH family outer membrane protein [Psychroserpens sp.]MBO6632180.1 OmpH family outer membrane protein [Psychroserpens sp.]MBO6655007.1 OmpH family outer membrane protein [Psychroserpens sp.]MBO6682919.1 OmpH family outer membrane protein [Psychroserpens sp.]MBO6751224.1 OmpH family outer membrane protein [Psychroserpens sp.]